ncbi:MAG: M16 family metallopeptidase [bacterium]
MKRILLAFAGLAAAIVMTATPVLADALPKLEYEKFELPNGLDVILYRDVSSPIVAVNVWYRVGSHYEKPGRTGFAHLFEHMMFQGSQHHDRDYFEPLEKVGAFVNGSTTEDRTNYLEDVPPNYLELALWLEADRMGFLLPAMTQEKLDNQRDVVKNERRQGLDNQPYAKADEIIRTMLYPSDHPYSWEVIGSMEDLSAASLEDVAEFFKMYYTPNNASLCIAGNFDPAQAKALVTKYFAPLPPGPSVTRATTWVPKLDGIKRGMTEDDVNLPRLYMSWHSAGVYQPGDAEMDLVASVLAGGKTSRLYKTLVYDQQIAQDVVAFQSSAELGSTFQIQATAREGHTLEEIEKAIDAELAKFLAKGASSSELANAKTVFEARFVRRMEEPGGFGGLSDQMNGYNTMLGSPDMFQWDLDRYMQVTPARLLEEARATLALDRRVIFRVMPRGALSAAEDEPLARANLPQPGPDLRFTPPSIERAKLGNGLELYVVRKNSLPLVQANLMIKSGWASDPADKPGAAALTAALLDEGTQKLAALEISETAKSLGANLGTGSEYDGSSVTLNVIKRNIAPAMNLMREIALRPTFPASEVERQRQIYLGRITQEEKQPFVSAFKTFQRELFGKDHPYGQPFTGSGTAASISAITRDDLLAFYRAHYYPNNAALIITGDVTMDEAIELAEKTFGSWEPGEVAKHDVPTPPALKETRICIVDKPGAAQSTITVGHLGLRRGDPAFDTFDVMNNTLGGQFGSRLNMNLREDKGYSYGTFALALGLRGVGPYVVFAPVQTQSTKEAISEIVKEIRDITQSRPATDEEVANSKSNLVQSFPQKFTSAAGIANEVESIVMYDLPETEWKDYVARINAISGQSATKVAKDFLRPDALLIVVVGDREKIEAGIRELGLGDVEVVTVASRENDSPSAH